MADQTREAIESLFLRWRRAVESRDFIAMREMLTPDARGGNAIYGVREGRDAVIEFSESNWPASVPNESVWYVIDGARLVNKWKEALPGKSPTGDPYDYFGISEFLYSPSGHWEYMYGLPDVTGLTRVFTRWSEDGNASRFPDVHPELARRG